MARLNTELNQQLGQVQGENGGLSDKLRETMTSLTDLKKSNTTLQRTYEAEKRKYEDSQSILEQRMLTVEAELLDTRERLASCSNRCANLDETLRSKQADFSAALYSKDDKIAEVKRYDASIHKY